VSARIRATAYLSALRLTVASFRENPIVPFSEAGEDGAELKPGCAGRE
jgi:hypothetical protein